METMSKLDKNLILTSKKFEQERAYWFRKLDKDIFMAGIPADHRRDEAERYETEAVSYRLEDNTAQRLFSMVKNSEYALYILLLSCVKYLLHRYNGQEDITVGMPMLRNIDKNYQGNILAIRTILSCKTFRELIMAVKNNVTEAEKNQNMPFGIIAEQLGLETDSRVPLIRTAVMMDNLHGREFMEEIKPDTVINFHVDGKSVNMEAFYNSRVYNGYTMNTVLKHIANIMDQITKNPGVCLEDIQILSEEEEAKIVHGNNQTKYNWNLDKTVQELFEEQVKRNPKSIAVVYEEGSLTYEELNRKANQLAVVLRNRGVGRETPVGIRVGRSLEMMVGILGIIKAGGAYLPVDPNHPDERVKHILKESGAGILLVNETNDPADLGCEVVCLKDAAAYKGEDDNLTPVNKPEDLLYVIYTSGSTGKPKGVMISHRSAINLVYGLKELAYKEYRDGLKVALLAPYVFDASVQQIFASLLLGHSLHIVPEEVRFEGSKLIRYYREHEIDISDGTPMHITIMLNSDTDIHESMRVKHFLIGGEALSAKTTSAFLERFQNSGVKITNVYGPTECCVDSTAYPIEQGMMDEFDIVPIGKPMGNVRIYILDQNKRLQPELIYGEVYIAGEGVGKGYMGNPALTEEKFTDNPFSPGEKLYRTGDLARWLPDGNIEYTGRMDHQVKVRGYRIELGEIENRLLSYPSIKEAVAVVKDDREGTKYLCAYVAAEKELTVSEIREYLGKELPEYMIPSYFIQVEKIPLTPNGKVDRKALPEPDGNIRTGKEYVAARNEVEKRLAEVWQEVLGVETVGIHDNFFELGGDSIKALQVSARMQKHRLKAEIKDLFKNPSIAQLEKYVKPVERKAYQGIVEGEVLLTPIQQLFFETSSTAAVRSHYNQAVMLYKEEGFREDILEEVFTKIVCHHDALRMVVKTDGNGFKLYNRGVEGERLYDLEKFIFAASEGYPAEVVKECSRIQGSINLEKGPLVKLGLFKAPGGDHLLIAIHHMVVDGVSWRILLEDFNNAYESAEKGDAIELQEKTDSYMEWAGKLSEYAGSRKALKELDYWKGVEGKCIKALPSDFEIGEDRQKDSANIRVSLTEEETQSLLKKVSRAYNTEINDILLSALGMAVKEWTGEDRVLVDMEGHGREGLLKDIDISRTVGWFTTMYPIVLDMSGTYDIGMQIKTVKEGLRRIPDKGIGYGILKYLAPPEAIKGCSFDTRAEIGFNYLGQFDEDVNRGAAGVSRLPTGETSSPEAERQHKLEINGMIAGGTLGLTISFNRHAYREETIRTLAEAYGRHLRKIITHCAEVYETELTPSDYGAGDITLEELEYIKENVGNNIQEIYSLSGMQEGMLFHALADSKSTAYFEQMSFKFTGELDINAFEKSFNELINRHAVLRTCIIGRGLSKPRQVVLKEIDIKIAYSELPREVSDKEEYLEELRRLDRERGFDLAEAPLMRLTVVKLEEKIHEVIWSHHHILMDGWCLNVILNEFYKIYPVVRDNPSLGHKDIDGLEKVNAYGSYIRWLEQLDREEALDYWADYLEGYQNEALLPVSPDSDKKDYSYGESSFTLDEKTTKALEALAKTSQVTINTVFQAIWGILLQKYNAMDDVVFGAVVSGRPPELEGIENMIGLFINTVPVRVICHKGQTFTGLVQLIQQQGTAGKNYEYISLAEIQMLSQQKNKLISNIVTFENLPVQNGPANAGSATEAGIVISNMEAFERTNYDFDVTVCPGRKLYIKFCFDASRYSPEVVQRMKGHLNEIAKKASENPDIPVHEIDLLTEQEKAQILFQFNNKKCGFPENKSVYHYVEEYAEKIPENTALIHGAASLTYRELNTSANRLAGLLIHKGIRSGELVAVMLERSFAMAEGIIGIWKAGGAYIPIDPDYPASRKSTIIRESGVRFVLTKAPYIDKEVGEEFEERLIDLSRYEDEIHKESTDNPGLEVSTEGLAYVIYTSGSTGKPKGAMIEHKGMMNHMHAEIGELGINKDFVIAQTANHCFDISVWQFFTALVTGGRTAIYSNQLILEPDKFIASLIRDDVSILEVVPSTLLMMMEHMEQGRIRLESLKYLMITGETAKPHIVRKWFQLCPDIKMVNAYGPAEASDDISQYIMDGPPEVENLPIGKPIQNMNIYIADNHMKLCPIGITGEICVSGVGVGRGYLNDEARTREVFVDDPFIEEKGVRLYKTGDTGKWLEDGNIEFVGRKDYQVKIRGYRIELGEIENRLLDHPHIKEAVVAAKEDKSGSKYLCAYAVAEKELTVQEIREHLIKTLPEYMVPAAFVMLEKMPLSSNGKVDRKALPEPENTIGDGESYVPPANETEERLTVIWQELLGIEHVSVEDSFFELGGHSLKAVTLASRIHKVFNREISIGEIFKAPTIRAISRYITGVEENLYASIEPVEKRDYYEVSSAQKRMYILNQFEENTTNYNMPGIYEVVGRLDREALDRTFRELIRRHESLRTSFELVDGEPVQRIHKQVDFQIIHMEVGQEEAEEAVRNFVRPFELSRAPLLRAVVLELPESKNVLMVDMHHIISDGISTDILAKEFWELYQGRKLPELRIQYKDYSAWQNRMITDGRISRQEKYWMKVFEGEIPVLNMPADYTRPQLQSFEGDNSGFELEPHIAKGLDTLAKENGATLFMALMATYNVLLSKYTGQEDIIVGTPVAGRPHADLENILGMFVNTLAIRNYPGGDKTFKEFLLEVKENSLKAYENQDYQFEELVEKLDIRRDLSRNPLFDAMFVLQNVETYSGNTAEIGLKPYAAGETVAKLDISLQAVIQGETVGLAINYCTRLFKKETIELMVQHFKNIFDEIVRNPEKKLKDIDMLSEQEKENVLHDFNDTEVEYPSNRAVHQLFEEQVRKSPDKIAAVFEDRSLTYAELNWKANQLARKLRKMGVNKDNIVGILVERSLEMLIGILAVLKAGGAYLPVDPEYPQDRIEYMLEDSGTSILLTSRSLKGKVNTSAETLEIDREDIYSGSASNLKNANTPEDLAYVIYTSGSTGKPKGVMIVHRAVNNFIKAMADVADFSEGKNILCLTTISFDIFVLETILPLTKGIKVVVAGENAQRDPKVLSELITQAGIDMLQLTPSRLQGLIYYDNALACLKNVKELMVGGEAFPSSLLEKINSLTGLRLYNMYGPTETTVWSAVKELTGVNHITIGKPVANTQVYILDSNYKLQPIGVAGELCISGDGLARGYLNRPDLTEAKFIQNPFVPGSKIYRTGDLAKWLPDGELECLGRVDHQVKIRGYRIELGEIENQLLNYPLIKEAVVIVKEDNQGGKYLCAYLTAEKELTVQEIREHLLRGLPEYMIPSYFMQVDKIPLTPNGKTDRKALPEPDGNIHTGKEYAAPRNRLEKRLAQVWAEILHAKTVGIHDNFFELGGDSIKALQVSARLHKHGLRLEIKDLFKNPTIGQLSSHVKAAVMEISQEAVEGEVQPSPIIKHFYETVGADAGRGHYNQSVMLFRKEGYKEEALEKVFTKIISHHDALRMVVRKHGDGMVLYNRGIEGEELFGLEKFDFSSLKDYENKVLEECGRIQGSIDLQHGPLVRLGLFRTWEGDHLLIVIHHLVVDAVSWRILLEDFNSAYEKAGNGEAIQLQRKTDSYKLWSEKLKEYSESKKALKHMRYWINVEDRNVKALPVDFKTDGDKYKDSASIMVTLTEEETQSLLKKVNKAYSTEINDILLTALGLAVAKWTGEDEILVDLEGHGREGILKEMDISRTVGWFTAIYPVVLQLSKAEDLGMQIKRVKEALRKIPDKGVGYGILKYLAPEEVKKDCSFDKKAEISFNYLGQFDEDINKGAAGLSKLSMGDVISPELQRQYKLEINGMVAGGKLGLTIGFNKYAYQEETIRRLSEDYAESLREIIRHCMAAEETQLTPSDYGDREITIEELEYIRETVDGDIEEIYSLSNMQEGMLFHALADSNSSAYFEQVSIKLQGDINVDVLEKSFNELIRRHAILRTNIISKGIRKPKQVVLKERKARIDYRDITAIAGDKVGYLEELRRQDIASGFDLAKEQLMRITVIRQEEKLYEIIWSHHHILMDGWCSGIIINELFKINLSLLMDKPIDLGEVYPYRSYIDWLENQDMEEALEYWSGYLEGYENTAALPGAIQRKAEGIYSLKEKEFGLGKALSGKLEEISARYNTTVNTLLQGIWGIVLQRYSNTDDVVFGTVVSGRPAEVEGIESMIGLFINTIPVRVQSGAEERFVDLMAKMQESALSSNEHDYVALPEIQSRSGLGNNLINHIMVFENFPIEREKEISGQEHQTNGLFVKDVKSFEQTNYDFNIIMGLDKEVTVRFSYNASAYEPDMVEKIAASFLLVAETVAGNPDIHLKEVYIADKEEMLRVCEDFNSTKSDYPRDRTLQELFEEQAEKTPDKLALVGGNRQLSYRELNHRANQIACCLREKGVGRGQIVGIIAERSPEMVIGMLAVLKAGGAYLPIDSRFPEDRAAYMMKDSRARLLLTQNFKGMQLGEDIEIVNLGSEEEFRCRSGANVENINQADDLAYIMYTSGTTGTPKGVMVMHRNVVRLVRNTNYITFREEDRILQTGSVVFDATTFEIWGALLNGLSLHIVGEDILLNAEKLEKELKGNGITILWLTSSLFNQLSAQKEEMFDGLRYLLVGGDILSVSHINRLWRRNNKINIVNGYGPTENTTFSTCFRIDKEYEANIPIGKPICNSTAYILDKNRRIQPVGAIGELFVGGDGVARGYINNEEMTREKFLKNPFKPGERLYRTGDMARWLPDGNIEFLGRMDHQVKIRGYRIEPGEIENRLLKHEVVKEAVVMAREDREGAKYLCAYIRPEKELKVQEIREHLLKELPDYMVPAYFIQLDKIPLTPNGKVDRRALPEPECVLGTDGHAAAPTNEIEELLLEIWKKVLGIKGIGIDDSFFELGGNSIKVMQLVFELQNQLHMEIQHKTVFKYSTVRSLAAVLKRNTSYDERPMVIFNEAAERKIFAFPPSGAYGIAYNRLANILPDYAFYSFDFFESAGRIRDYAESIASIQENGPYILMGYSGGGNIAFEVAKELIGLGYEVSDILMIDASLFEEKLGLTDEQIARQVENSIYSILEANPHLKESLDTQVREIMVGHVYKKMQSYLEYMNELVSTGKAKSNIHFIMSDLKLEDERTVQHGDEWSKYTEKEYKMYPGYGAHNDMVEGYAEQNASIIRNILKGIEAREKGEAG